MSKVHEFSVATTLYSDTRIPFQYRGGGESAAARAMTLALLLAWIEANITPTGMNTVSITGGAPSVVIPAGRLLEKMVVMGSGTGTFNLGTTVSGTEILAGEGYNTTGMVYVLDQYFNSAASIYFSGFSGTLTVKLYWR